MHSHSKGKKGQGLSEVNQQLKEEIERRLVDGRLPCKDAHELAERLKIDLAEIGTTADGLDIKISHCQLGCF